MKFEDFLFNRRTRQNHALEHATVTILGDLIPELSISARSNTDGFIIFGDVDLGLLRRAVDEALRRLLAGESELAIHPNCGTNIAVGITMVTVGGLLGMTSSHMRTRVATTVASTFAGMAAARPVGEYVQRHFTTLADLKGVRVTEIARRKFLNMTFVEVRTIQE